jgi:hypothetical protein
VLPSAPVPQYSPCWRLFFGAAIVPLAAPLIYVVLSPLLDQVPHWSHRYRVRTFGDAKVFQP